MIFPYSLRYDCPTGPPRDKETCRGEPPYLDCWGGWVAAELRRPFLLQTKYVRRTVTSHELAAFPPSSPYFLLITPFPSSSPYSLIIIPHLLPLPVLFLSCISLFLSFFYLFLFILSYSSLSPYSSSPYYRYLSYSCISGVEGKGKEN